MSDQGRIQRVLERTADTRCVELGAGAVAATGSVFRKCFGPATALVVADANTLAVAGAAVAAALGRHGVAAAAPVILEGRPVAAHMANVTLLEERLREGSHIPIAVGSGTVNDLVKLAAHRAGRSYLAVATAASMDGYTSYGASITRDGIKQTVFCPAPAALVCDLDIVSRAPAAMNAAGYADLLAKVPCGADWILADALGVEPVHQEAWDLMQPSLRQWLGDPDGVREGRAAAVANLMEGLLMAGFAMQVARSSRPASGAEHQFSHLWDMEGHKHHGAPPSHGFKVGIGTIATTVLYWHVLAAAPELPATGAPADRWPAPEEALAELRDLHSLAHIRAAVEAELPLKYPSRDELRRRLERARACWPALSSRLADQLMPVAEIRDKLVRAGAVADPAGIGITPERLAATYRRALGIRRRYTILDFASETGLLQAFLRRAT